MHRIVPVCVEAAAAAVFLIPIFLYLHKTRLHSRRTGIIAFLFALYLCAVYAMAGLPNVLYIRFDPHFNFRPFLYMFSDVTSVLNVLMFLPLGFFLPVLRAKFRTFRATVSFGFVMSAFIELAQIFTKRATDINDLMTNTLGTILGYWIAKVLLKLFPGMAMEEDPKELRIICFVVLGVMIFCHPFLSALVWRIIY